MIDPALHAILAPAYQPCAHLSGACAGACRWDPAAGHVPCGFGGATGSLEDVRLIIVTAEPSGPSDEGGYEGTPAEMVERSLDIFESALNGGITRGGRPYPFHRGLRVVLDAFWPGENLGDQLGKTWATNTVLCPAETPDADHQRAVALACTSTYLARQLELFPNAFVLVLGDKARNRMRAAGLRLDATALHPSARSVDEAKPSSWERAARKFRGESRSGAPVPPIPEPLAAVPPKTPAPRPSARSLLPEGKGEPDLQAAIAALPAPIATFFERLMRHPDYACAAGRMQMTVQFRGEKLGGLNRNHRHWYVSRVFANAHGSPEILAAHGFSHVVKNEAHSYWMAKGLEACGDFERAMVWIQAEARI